MDYNLKYLIKSGDHNMTIIPPTNSGI